MNRVAFRLKKDGKIVGYLKISSGFIFMKDVSRPDLDWQNYSYFNSGSCPVWDDQELIELSSIAAEEMEKGK